MGSSLSTEPSDYQNIITNFKRIIGLRYIDKVIKNNRDYLSFSIIDQNNVPTIRLLIENKIKLVSFESILTRLLNELKKISENKLN
jgi:molecular chaperone DnaK (HSP70)